MYQAWAMHPSQPSTAKNGVPHIGALKRAQASTQQCKQGSVGSKDANRQTTGEGSLWSAYLFRSASLRQSLLCPRVYPYVRMFNPLCDIPSGCCFLTGPWTVTHSSLRMLRWVAAFCRPLRPVLLLVSFPRSRSPVVGALGLCWCPPPPVRSFGVMLSSAPTDSARSTNRFVTARPLAITLETALQPSRPPAQAHPPIHRAPPHLLSRTARNSSSIPPSPAHTRS